MKRANRMNRILANDNAASIFCAIAIGLALSAMILHGLDALIY
jgi:hypothetical protein